MVTIQIVENLIGRILMVTIQIVMIQIDTIQIGRT